MNKKYANVVGREAPNTQTASAQQRGAMFAGVCAFRTLHKHTIGGEDFFLLAKCLSLEVGDAARKQVGIHDVALLLWSSSSFFSYSYPKAGQSPTLVRDTFPS